MGAYLFEKKISINLSALCSPHPFPFVYLFFRSNCLAIWVDRKHAIRIVKHAISTAQAILLKNHSKIGCRVMRAFSKRCTNWSSIKIVKPPLQAVLLVIAIERISHVLGHARRLRSRKHRLIHGSITNNRGGAMHQTVHGGEGEIRTLGTVSRTTDFKSVALDHSATSPCSTHRSRTTCFGSSPFASDVERCSTSCASGDACAYSLCSYKQSKRTSI
jgi:hypothetical protein